MDFEDRAALDPARGDALRATLTSHATLAEVVRWLVASRSPRFVHDVVVQDEFTHDVVVPFEDLWIVYDTT